VFGGGREEHCKPGSGARERAADLEAVVVAETDVEEHGLGREARDGIQRGRGAIGFCHDCVAAPLQQLPRGARKVGSSSMTSTRGAPAAG